MKLPNLPTGSIILSSLFFISLLLACQSKDEQTPDGKYEEVSAQTEEGIVPEVRVAKSEIKPFVKRLWTNGKLKASRSLAVKSQIKGQIEQIFISEGEAVQNGQLLVRFNDEDLQLQKKQAQLALEEAIYKKNDLLVLQGGTWGIDSSVNRQTFNNILLESGLKRARLEIEKLEFQQKFYEIYAPFSGMVADLQIQSLQDVEAGAVLFTIYDPGSLEAEFQLMETELSQIEKGQLVRIHPTGWGDESIRAKLTVVNPIVDQNGLITARAKINGESQIHQRFLPEGMAVKVAIEHFVPGQLVIPRSAVVLRSERPVVFSWDPDSGLAKWNYVAIAMEEQNEVAISEGLDKDTWVIYEGNLNLDHDAAVKVVNAPNFASQ